VQYIFHFVVAGWQQVGFSYQGNKEEEGVFQKKKVTTSM
jgi:hypothetical protein